MPSYQLNPEDYAVAWDEWDPSWRTLYDADLVAAPETGIQRLFGDERYLLSAWVLSEAMARLGAPAYRYYLDVPALRGCPCVEAHMDLMAFCYLNQRLSVLTRIGTAGAINCVVLGLSSLGWARPAPWTRGLGLGNPSAKTVDGIGSGPHRPSVIRRSASGYRGC